MRAANKATLFLVLLSIIVGLASLGAQKDDKETVSVEYIYAVFNALAYAGINYGPNELSGIRLYDGNNPLPFIFDTPPSVDDSLWNVIKSSSFWMVDFNDDIDGKNPDVFDNCSEWLVDSKTLAILNTHPVVSVKTTLPSEPIEISASDWEKSKKIRMESASSENDNRKEIIATINKSVSGYLKESMKTPSDYRIIFISRKITRAPYRDGEIKKFMDELKFQHCTTVVLESKTDSNDAYCFILSSKDFSVIKMFDKKYIGRTIQKLDSGK